jgi:hypothetical protein
MLLLACSRPEPVQYYIIDGGCTPSNCNSDSVPVSTQSSASSSQSGVPESSGSVSSVPASVSSESSAPAISLTTSVEPGLSYHVQLSGALKTYPNVKLYEVDLFDTSDTTIQALKNTGAKVLCYFSAGSAENWRADFSQFPSATLGKGLDGWQGENWLDIRNSAVRSIMANRMTLAKQKGCDGVDPDNVDGYSNDSGFPLTSAHQLDYNRFLANTAHTKGLLVALKNSADLAAQLSTSFDLAVVEECAKYSECSAYSSFVAQKKAVLMIEYASKVSSKTCQTAKSLGFDLVFYNLDLDGKQRLLCP